ncbi:SH3 domain-containing protein [Motiliproteus sp. MSK22-1]|uniref:SH3 domain-containing protein n=1 Tax=Motiliproteus sp. MSK22-1 TaxID=1897630 RepID=UPI0009773664|nr:SH3 domain-containing protein [Motiliproteus sp. MSK22-1]OMH39050.1 hypothetical protein BGP75_04865 [Motiliproteus sp. MSK22-1]
MISAQKNIVSGAVIGALLLLGGCISNETKPGGESAVANGSGEVAGIQGEPQELVLCEKPVGTAALLDAENSSDSQYQLTSPVPLVKRFIEQSRCFSIVDRSPASATQTNSQKTAADYIITPTITDTRNTFGSASAQVALSVINVQTGHQETIAEGLANKSNVGFAWGTGLVGNYGTTDIGKVTTAAFLDAHNKLIGQLGASTSGSISAINSKYQATTTVNFRRGPSTSSVILGKLLAGATVHPTGTKEGDWWQVEANDKTGWVHSDYLTQ